MGLECLRGGVRAGRRAGEEGYYVVSGEEARAGALVALTVSLSSRNPREAERVRVCAVADGVRG